MAAPGSGAFACFIGNTDCTFAMVERKEERDDLAIWCNKLVDIQKQYKIISNGQEKDSVVDLAETIIDP